MEEKESELKKEYNKLHERYTEVRSLLKMKCLDDPVVSACSYESQGPRFEYRLRQNSAYDLTALRRTEPFIITLPLSWYDFNKGKMYVNTKPSFFIKNIWYCIYPKYSDTLTILVLKF